MQQDEGHGIEYDLGAIDESRYRALGVFASDNIKIGDILLKISLLLKQLFCNLRDLVGMALWV